MTLDRRNNPPNAKPSTTTNAPRLAGKGPQTPSNVRSPVSTSAPVLRKQAQAERYNANATNSNGSGPTPVNAFLGSNITPRSGSRKARVESASSTPRRTPESTPPIGRPVSMIEGRDWPSGGPKIARAHGARGGDVQRHARAQSVASDVQYPVRLSLSGGDAGGLRTASPETLPKFFHANEAKPSRSVKPRSQSPRMQPRLAASGYPDGVSYDEISLLSRSPEPEDEPPIFLHADGTQSASPPVSKLINGAFSARPPLQTIFSSYQTTNSPVQRPPSPLKEEVLPVSRKSSLSKPSPRRHTRLVSNGSKDIRAPDATITGQSDISRRSSLHNPANRISQPQSPISASFGNTTSRRSSIALSDHTSQSVMFSGPNSAEPPSTERVGMISPELIPQSPSRPAPGQSKLDHLNELAANARRERKVLDLEISNSSLLAINRTLEAEMRKQKVELRRFRRLRSSGRFPSSTRSASSRFSMPSASDDLSPTSSADEDGLDDDHFSNPSSGTSDDTSFPDSLSFSPTPRNSLIPVAKGRQSRPFKLDLSAQRVLLLDSQKLNQALKRCLGRTDDLIADGKKALAYTVNTGDVASLGPRVLIPDERGEELGLGRGLLSPGLEEKMENPWERILSMREISSGLQTRKSEGLMLDIPAHGDPAQGSNEEGSQSLDVQETMPRTEADILEPDPQDSIQAIHQNPGANTPLELVASEAPITVAADEIPACESRTPDKLDIPYEDPGIDAGSETRSIRIEPKGEDPGTGSRTPDDNSYTEISSDESTEAEGPSISSPGKGLGDFLRMVGGSWGV